MRGNSSGVKYPTAESMIPRRVKVYAPATISNLGPGFDILGIAIRRPGDIVIAERCKEPGLHFALESQDPRIPSSARDNVAGHVALLMLREMKPQFGIRMTLKKKMPLGSGLGSSGASSVASVVAVNALLPQPLPKYELLRFAAEGERKACGAPHADNVAPSLLGGLCLISSYDPLDVLQLPVSNRLIWIVVHPHLLVRTKDARAFLPGKIPLATAIRQWGNVSGVTAGLISGNELCLKKCIEDNVAEPVRARLIPGFEEVKRSSLRSGALGCSISGSGPSLFAVTTRVQLAEKIANAMVRSFRREAGAGCDVYISKVNRGGATVQSIP